MPRLAACLLLVLATGVHADDRLAAQREAFRAAHANAELGLFDLADDERALLGDYILWPDLEAAWLRARLGQGVDAGVEPFLAAHGELKPARELRYRYTLWLARRQRHADFRRYYERHYASLGVARLDCLALDLEVAGGLPASLPERARSLWLVAHSQARECDRPFERLRAAGLIDEALVRERFRLAVAARELGMARYLARALGDAERHEAGQWTAAYGRPRVFLEQARPALAAPVYREQLLAAVERIAYDDAATAQQHWHALRDGFGFEPVERARVDRHVALWLARQHAAGAAAALDDLAGDAVDDEVRRWRVRTALREQRWDAVLGQLERLGADDRDDAGWRYWRAVALRETGQGSADALFLALAGERDYYGFLAADALGIDYDYGHSALAADEAALADLARRPELARARELFMVGLDSRGRSEWDAAVRGLPADLQLQAAILAHRWGWHSRAIATAARVDSYDDLALRYPLPYAEQFEQHARQARISPSWALGVARSESLFMPDIRSSAGAVGVMQLLPSTGRQSARELNAPFHGQVTLTDPASNIRLGTWYLGRMQARFFDNPVLATAAYNAGPQRVENWLPAKRPLDARVWIETIPYAETRSYVRRVLTADTIFDWRLGRADSRLSQRLQEVPAPAARVGNAD